MIVALIVVAAIVLFCVAIAFWVRWLARRRAVWFARHNDAIPVNAEWWRGERGHEGELLYVAIGDSAAQGIGASRPDRSYVGQLATRLRDTTGRTIRVVNLAVSGATVGLALRDQVPRLRSLKPDIVTVSIGANDVADWDPSRFEREYGELVAALPDHAIVADLPSFYVLPRRHAVAQANFLIWQLAEARGLRVADLHDRTHNQGGWGIMTQFSGDLFHPNDRGYKIWADAFWPAVAERAAAV